MNSSPFFHLAQLKNMKPEEYRLIMRNLELHYQDYMRDSQNSQLFGPDDRMQVEENYTKTTHHFDNLLHSMEKGNIYSPTSCNSRALQSLKEEYAKDAKYVQTTLLCIMYISGIRVARFKGESSFGSQSKCVHRLMSFGWGVHKNHQS